jgi:hypothetical protein
VTRLCGWAALLGGLAWTVKGVVILVGYQQPPLLFDVAPTLFGLGLLGVATARCPLVVDATWRSGWLPSRFSPTPPRC